MLIPIQCLHLPIQSLHVIVEGVEVFLENLGSHWGMEGGEVEGEGFWGCVEQGEADFGGGGGGGLGGGGGGEG